MKVEWTNFTKYPDGSISDYIEGTFTIGDKSHVFAITDHSREHARNKDEEYRWPVPYAYDIVSDFLFSKNTKSFEMVGFEKFNRDHLGLDLNPGYKDGSSKYRFAGEPEHTLNEVKELLIKGFIEYFRFDYKQELEDFIAALDKRQNLMNEAEAYKSSEKHSLHTAIGE